jgi:8-oxo-dGTP pyrophosphatase MutT (NUDIX family)
VSGAAPDERWRDALHSRADQPPLRERVALWWEHACIGSVEPELFTQDLADIARPPLLVSQRRDGEAGWCIGGELTASLAQIAHAMREAGVAHVWRDEQLPVGGEGGAALGTVERAAVRPLGIATYAVHLAGRAPDGRHWVQQRSLTKANDPGLWDTLMGGMVPACDSPEQALARETWEEAGLAMAQLADVSYGGRIPTRRPVGGGQRGYVVEYIDWYRCTVPHGVAPVNQDGEVAQFCLMHPREVTELLRREEFTLEAALVLLAAGL